MELTRAEIRNPEAEPFVLADVIEEGIGAFRDKVSINTQRVVQQLSVLGNADVMHAVLEILFENAIQHDATELTLWTNSASPVIELFVQDNGTGISASNREQVFNAFFTTQRAKGGTGLGLTIATALLKQIQGELQLVSEDGPTTFKITLRSA